MGCPIGPGKKKKESAMKQLPSIIGSVAMIAVLVLGLPVSGAGQHRQGGGGGAGTSGGGGGGRTSGGGGERAVPRGDAGGGRTSAPQPVTGGSAAAAPQRGSEAERGGERAQPASRQRAGSTGDVAVARRSLPPSSSGPVFINRGYYYYPWGYGGYGYYPWGYGGYGFGAYSGGYYDPWFYGGYNGLSVGLGYYGGGYPGPYYPAPYYGGFEEGSVRIKVKPRNGSVYVDGYFAGQVDDYDGTFQRLHVEPGPHRIEVRADGHAPLSFEIHVPPGRTVSYSGELKRLP